MKKYQVTLQYDKYTMAMRACLDTEKDVYHIGVLGYLEAENFMNEEYHKEFLEDIEQEIGRN